MESIIPMTVGLLLDICGSFLIVKLILNNIQNSRFFVGSDGKLWQSSMSNYHDDKKEYDRQNQAVIDARYGFVFLSSGFILILIASWINYLNV
ncbi:MAG: hypothetical protein ACW9W4_06325 [Candidatus Nitrosopumilus sp. bin_7KS]